MRFTYRNYGQVDITAFEKAPSQVRVRPPRERVDVVGPRRRDNILRSKQICVRRMLTAVAKYGPPLFITLTFEGDASDASYANDALRRFQVRVRSEFVNPHSLFVPELSPKGRIHFHGFLFNVPMHLGDTKKGRRIISHGTERKDRRLRKCWGEGHVDCLKTDGSRRMAYYLAKYVTKGGEQVMFNAMRLVRISRGFPKELVIRGRLAKLLAEKYSQKKPIREWDGENEFLGKINKKTYDKF